MSAMDKSGGAGQAPLPFKLGWWAADLGTYRSCDGTYCFSSYESLPPLPPLDGSLSWLGALPDAVDQQMEPHRNAAQARGALAPLREQADRLGLVLPGAFLRLMGSPELQDRIPSCTACYFRLSRRIAPYPSDTDGQASGQAGGYVIRFLNDQQDVFAWYLYLTPAGDHCVLVSPYALDSEGEGEHAGEAVAEREQRMQAIRANTWVCAPSFEAFIYRFWLENVLWFKLNESQPAPLTTEERRYLAHYGLREGDAPQ